MNLYQTQHPFYCGIDLHAKEMYACVVDQDGKKQLHRNFKTRQSDKFFEEIERFGKRHRHRLRVNFQLVLASRRLPRKTNSIRARSRPVPQSDPRWQSQKRQTRLRKTGVATARRKFYHRLRLPQKTESHAGSAQKTHSTDPAQSRTADPSANRQPPTKPRRPLKRRSPTSPIGADSPSNSKTKYQSLGRLWTSNNSTSMKTNSVDLSCTSNSPPKSTTRRPSSACKRFPASAASSRLTMLYEIHDINRFPTVGQFLSYCRLVKGSHSSAGKSYGSPGKKIGNAYLKWAFGETVPLIKRCCPEAKTFLDRIEKRHGKARAFSYLSVKLGRAVYCMLKRKEAFDLHRLLRSHEIQR